MPIQKSKILLDKINVLHQRISDDQVSVSNLERDLMLDLIRQLYDSFLDFSSQEVELPITQIAVVPQEVAPEPSVIIVPPPVPAVENQAPQNPEKIIPTGMEALFDFKRATELLEKLGEQPIRDLAKALSINDRLLYMNELFGKDLEAMNESLKLLNKFESFEGGKSFLVTLAGQYDWLAENRVAIARDFIRLVRRRYV